jgi:F0F1-type ATP synthase assembly protein I
MAFTLRMNINGGFQALDFAFEFVEVILLGISIGYFVLQVADGLIQ